MSSDLAQRGPWPTPGDEPLMLGEHAGDEPRRFHAQVGLVPLSGAVFSIYDRVMGSSGIQIVKIARGVPSHTNPTDV
jgi:hypothetical protein